MGKVKSVLHRKEIGVLLTIGLLFVFTNLALADDRPASTEPPASAWRVSLPLVLKNQPATVSAPSQPAPTDTPAPPEPEEIAIPPQPVRAQGPGLAGCPDTWPVVEGVQWSYKWGIDAEEHWWCIPMLRSNALFDVSRTMNSCGGLCNAILVGNEMESQERCDLGCQARHLHEVYSQILAENPQAQVIFWNGAYPSPGWVDLFVATWQTSYPGEPLPVVDIGVHLYSDNLNLLGRFEDRVHSYWPNAQVLVTEGGDLYDRSAWQRWLDDVTPHLDTYAPFLWGEDSDGLLCSMGNGSGPMTECGEAYQTSLSARGG